MRMTGTGFRTPCASCVLWREPFHRACCAELLGLTLYRLGRWRPARKELEEYRAMSGSFDQLPAMMDCDRALHLHRGVDHLWEELREASPSAEVVAEGRIVMAGSLADRGDLAAGIKLDPRCRRS